MLKKYIPTLIFMVLVYGWYFLVHQQAHPSKLNVLGASTNLQLYVQPETGHEPILDAINSAQKEILVEVYLLSDKQIINALEHAESRGVDVKVMMEEHPVGSSSLNKKTQQELSTDGITTEWSDPSFTLTHEKSITIDDSETFILSQNLTASAFSKNREYDVLDTNPTDVTEVRSIFIDDWERESFSPPTDTNLIESPDNSRAALTTLVNNATTSIDAETEDIDDNQLIQDLSEKAKTIPVRLIVPTLSQLSSNQTALQKLTTAGVQVRTISSPYMHAKMILADDDKAYIGSINFSTQSMDDNRELGIILTQQNDLQILQDTFETDWSRADAFQN